MNITTDKWETMDQIKRRLGLRAETAIAAVVNEHRQNKNVCRFVTVQGVSVTEWRKK